MGTVASGTLYLAFSLAAGSHPVVAPPADTPTAAAQPAPQPLNYVIIDLPRVDRPSKTLATVIAEEAARAPSADNDSDPAAQTQAMTGVNDAVVAEHDTRVALLKQRIATLKPSATGDTAAQLRDLGTRLKRAEAARALAVARAALSVPCAAQCDARLAEATPDVSPDAAPALSPVDFEPGRGAQAPAAPKPRAATTGHKTRLPSAFVTIKRPAVPAQRFRMPQTFAAAPRHLRRYPPARTAQHLAAGVRFVLRPRGAVAVKSASTGHLAVRVASDRRTAAKLQRSRQLLAKARKALAPSSPLQGIEIAGLWKFDGSARWSLADIHRRSI